MTKLGRVVQDGTLMMGALLVISLASGCHDSSSGGDQPAASASADPSAAPSASTASNDDTPAGSGSDQAGDDYDDTDPSAVTDFHQTLDAHGSWTDDPKYGTVWVPAPATVGASFVPYQTGGHWVYDGNDYIWVSNWDWGWAPFHYGRWAFIDGTGWGWIPGRVYAPAWVTWRVGAPGYGFVGWAPLAPTWGWRAGVVTTFGFAVEPRFTYVANVDLFSPVVATRVVVGARVAGIAAATRPFGVGASVGVGVHVAGPSPASVGVASSAVAHPSPNDPGLAKAKGFSKPSTAAAQGGHPPAKSGSSAKAKTGNDTDKDKDKDKPSTDKDKPSSDKDKPSSDTDKPGTLKDKPSPDKPSSEKTLQDRPPNIKPSMPSKGGSKPSTAPKKEK